MNDYLKGTLKGNKTSHLWKGRIFGLTWLAYAGFYFCRKNFSVAMPILTREMGTSKENLAIAITIYSLMYMLGQFLNGYMSDKKGPRIIVSIGILISVLANLFMGFAGSIATFTFLMGLNGLGQSAGWSGTVKNMTPWFSKKERGVVMSFWTTNYVIGGIAATAFTTYWVTHETFLAELSWRRAFWAPVIVLSVIGVIYVVFTRNHPSEVGGEIQRQENKVINESVHAAKKKAQKDVLSSGAVWTAAAMYFFVKFSRYAFLFWLPLYLSEALGYTDKQAGYTSISYEAVGFFGVIAAGFISDKLWQSRRFPVASIMLFCLAGVLLLQPVLTIMGMTATIVSIGLIGFFTYGPDSIMSGAAAMDIGKSEGAALAAGIINGVGSFGQLLSPLVVAYVAINFGWDALFKLFVVVSFIAGAILILKWNYGKPKLNTNK